MKVSQAYSSQKARYAPTDVFIANGFSFKITGFTLPQLSLRRTVSQMCLIFLFGLFRINKQPSTLLQISTLIQVYNMAASQVSV